MRAHLESCRFADTEHVSVFSCDWTEVQVESMPKEDMVMLRFTDNSTGPHASKPSKIWIHTKNAEQHRKLVEQLAEPLAQLLHDEMAADPDYADRVALDGSTTFGVGIPF